MKNICLFENYENQPPALAKICESWNNKMENGLNYENCKKFKKEVENIGFTFDYGLDAQPYDLKPL
jgi:predicted nucleotide-binding protein (sugar kinase/HSP70/actin superfamily)